MRKKIDKLQTSIWIIIGIYIIVTILLGLFMGVLESNDIKLNIFVRIIITSLPIIVLILSLFNTLNKRPYICKNCKGEIYIRFHQMFALHAGSQRRIKCPHCGKTAWAELKNE